MDEEYKEITLADIVGTLGRRKFVLVSVFLLVVAGGVAYTVFTTPEYESTTTIVPLEHGDIIKNWLDSRQAGELVAEAMGEPLTSKLFPSEWDEARGGWRGEPPSREAAGARVAGATSVDYRQGQTGTTDRFLALTVRLTDPILARDVANAYMETLEELRPELERATENELFATFYAQSGNAQDARARAEEIAQNTDYWLRLDTANTPGSPVSPNVTLNIALSVVLGLMLAVFAVFFWEWMSNYRAERRRVEVPEAAPEPQEEERKRRYS